MSTRNITLGPAELASPLWQDAPLWRLWCWCRASAARRRRTASLGGVPLRLEAGQLAATPDELALGTGLARHELLRALNLARRLGLVDLTRTPWGLRIAIVDWQ